MEQEAGEKRVLKKRTQRGTANTKGLMGDHIETYYNRSF